MPDHDPTTCAAVDHRYWTFTVIWCPHRQQFTLRRSTYLESGTADDPVDYDSHAVGLGPFDTGAVAAALLTTWINQARSAWDPVTPGLPG